MVSSPSLRLSGSSSILNTKSSFLSSSSASAVREAISFPELSLTVSVFRTGISTVLAGLIWLKVIVMSPSIFRLPVSTPVRVVWLPSSKVMMMTFFRLPESGSGFTSLMLIDVFKEMFSKAMLFSV